VVKRRDGNTNLLVPPIHADRSACLLVQWRVDARAATLASAAGRYGTRLEQWGRHRHDVATVRNPVLPIDESGVLEERAALRYRLQ
jgi:hypothetical protein